MPPVTRQQTTNWQAGGARVDRAFNTIIQAAAVKATAAQQSEPLKNTLTQRANASIAAVAESLAATPPSPMIPNPWLAPSPAALTLATQLTVFASNLQPGPMRDALESAAGDLVKAGYEGTQGQQ